MASSGADEKRVTRRFEKYWNKKAFRSIAADERERVWVRADICMRKGSQILIGEVKAGGRNTRPQTKRNNFDRGMSLITQRMVRYRNTRYALVLPDYAEYRNAAKNISPEFRQKNNFCIYIVPRKRKPYVLTAAKGKTGFRYTTARRRRARLTVVNVLATLHGEYSVDEILAKMKGRRAKTGDRQGLRHAVHNALHALKEQGRARNVARGIWQIFK